MSNEINYKDLGFKCGIEIHQQLSTDTKLFCECPIDLEDEHADSRVERYLRAVKGESGESDMAAEKQAQKEQKFIYKYYKRNNCLVEIDEEPPHSLDQEALDVGLTFARMVEAEIPDEIQVMRKIVVDGSNTSGFQRTAMIGLDGELETESGTVSIEDIELEEESAGIHKRDEDKAIYDLNRLGIPLIEVGTDASVKNPEHAREVAEKIGMLLRSTGKARRGLGTIRQDVNVSIADGARVEIKGFQDVGNIDKLIELEVKRQKNLVELGEELPEDVKIRKRDVTGVFEGSENQIISSVLENNGAVYALKLPEMTGKMKQKISGERYVAKELVDYVKSQGPRGMIHTDEDIDGYGLVDEFNELEDEMNKSEDDVIAIIAAPRSQAENAAEEAKRRAEILYKGKIPEETRAAEQDFTTSYSRPLPGAARMYPETDIPEITVTGEKVEEIDQKLPDTLEEREEKYSEEIGEELASQIVHSENLLLFEKFKDKADPKTVANVFTNIYSQLEKEGVDVESLEENYWQELFGKLSSGVLEKGDIEDVLEKMTESSLGPEEVVEEALESKSGEDEIREAVESVIEEKSEMVEEQGMHAQGALMGLVMQRVDADGGTVSQILQEKLQEKVD